MNDVVLDRRRGVTVGPGRRVFIVAEAGVNHNGRLSLAKRLVDEAVRAGADAVKFQTFRSELVVSPSTPLAEYQERNTGRRDRQVDMLRALELKAADYAVLRTYCRRKGIMFLSTPFDEPSVDLLDALDVPAFKISSGDVTNVPLLERVASRKRPVILSTGMSSLAEVKAAVRTLRRAGCPGVILLHCVTNYPSDPADANLRAIPAMAKATRCPVGLSDHSLGVTQAVASVALGACVIEKHFTLDSRMEGPDHRASLEPDELALLVRSVREVESALGDGVKRAVRSERGNLRLGRRSLHWSRDLPAGQIIREGDLVCLCPGTGMAPALKKTVLGCRVTHPVKRLAMVRRRDLSSRRQAEQPS